MTTLAVSALFVNNSGFFAVDCPPGREQGKAQRALVGCALSLFQWRHSPEASWTGNIDIGGLICR